jgi:hypothetical protein
MSKKTIPFKLAPRTVLLEAGTDLDPVGKSQTPSAEAWVQRPQTAAGDSQWQPGSSGRNIFVLHDDPTWVDVMLAATIMPSFAWWLWALGGFRSAIRDR